jgi:hypothetical protein
MAASASTSPSASATEQTDKVLSALRLSEDGGSTSPSSTVPNGITVNGHAKGAPEDGDVDPVTRLQRDLERTREEKETLAAQYRNLLSRLTTMKNTLGNKLKQDAVRRATWILASF